MSENVLIILTIGPDGTPGIAGISIPTNFKILATLPIFFNDAKILVNPLSALLIAAICFAKFAKSFFTALTLGSLHFIFLLAANPAVLLAIPVANAINASSCLSSKGTNFIVNVKGIFCIII